MGGRFVIRREDLAGDGEGRPGQTLGGRTWLGGGGGARRQGGHGSGLGGGRGGGHVAMALAWEGRGV